MTTAYTSLLGFALPVTGELSGTWGDTVNDGITKLLDSAVAGTTTITLDQDVTLTTTTGASNTSRQAILLWTAGGTATRTITAPAQSKIYTVINASSSTQSIILAGVGPTTGVTIAKGESALVAWNGSDFIKISNTAGPGTFTNLTVTGNTILGDTDTDTITTNSQFVTGTQLKSAKTATNTLSLAAYDVDGAAYTNLITLTASNTPTLALTSTGVGTMNNIDIGGTAARTGAFTTLSASSTVTLSGGTANGVAFLNGSNVLTTGSALTFDGTNLSVGTQGEVRVYNTANTRYGRFLTSSSGTLLQSFNGSNEPLILDAPQSGSFIRFDVGSTEGFRLTSSSLYTASGINLLVGSSSSYAGKVQSWGTVTANAGTPNFSAIDTTPMVSGVGGELAFIGQYQVGDYAYFGSIRGIKENGTIGNTACALTFFTRPTATAPVERMRIDSSGNVGIGTTTPNASYRLDIAGNSGIRVSGGTVGSVAIRSASGYSNFVNFNENTVADRGVIGFGAGSGSMQFRVNGAYDLTTGTQAMTLDASGNLGIGTTSPVSYGGGYRTVEAKGSTTTNGGVFRASTSDASYIGAFYVNSTGTSLEASGATPILFLTNSSERARIDSSGNLGIGTSSPDTRLDIELAAVTPSNSSYHGIVVGPDSGTTSLGQGVGIGFRLRNTAGGGVGGNGMGAAIYGIQADTGANTGALAFYTRPDAANLTERARIDSSGNLLIGTTGLPVANGTRLSISGSGEVARILGTTTGNPSLALDKSTNDSTTGQVFATFTINNQGAGSGQINANGASQAAFGSFSDRRLKQNIVDLPPQLANIMALRPVEFDYIESEGGGHQTGFIAQEMETIFPDSVGERSDGMKTVTGWNKTEAILIKAIQEQQAIITQLTARITALESV